MADNTQLSTNVGSGDVVRTEDRAGVKTQIVGLDLNPAGSEVLGTGDATNGLDVDVTRVQAATATTAPVFTMDYVDAAGTSKTGTRTTTLPAAITTQNSCFFPPLENDTTGVRDVSAVNVTVAATAGTANLYLLENLCFTTTPVLNMPGVFDGVYTGFTPPRLDPAVATSGTASYVTTIVSLATSSTDTGTAYIKAVVES